MIQAREWCTAKWSTYTQTGPTHDMFKHSASVHILLWYPWSSGPCFTRGGALHAASTQRILQRILPKHCMKLKTRLAAKSGNCQRFNVNGQVTAKLETPNKRIMKSNSGCAIAPIGVTLNPLKTKSEHCKWNKRRWISWDIWSRTSSSDRPFNKHIKEAMLSIYHSPVHLRNSFGNVTRACSTISNSNCVR